MSNLLLSTWGASGSIRKYLKKDWFTFIHYHRIDPDSFEEHMEYLSRHYSLTPLDSLRKHYENGAPLPKDSLFITFDDGWCSNFSLLPIIEEKDIPVTIFLTTGFIGTNKKPAPITSFQENAFNDQENMFFVESSRTMLNIEQIKKMSKVVDFQSHGVYHHPSTSLTTDQFRSDLLESKRTIENITGKHVYAFAYPYNRASEREAQIVASCGYVFARAGERIMNKTKTNQFLLYSIGIENDCTVSKLKKKILKAELKTLFYS